MAGVRFREGASVNTQIGLKKGRGSPFLLRDASTGCPEIVLHKGTCLSMAYHRLRIQVHGA